MMGAQVPSPRLHQLGMFVGHTFMLPLTPVALDPAHPRTRLARSLAPPTPTTSTSHSREFDSPLLEHFEDAIDQLGAVPHQMDPQPRQVSQISALADQAQSWA